MSPSVSARCVPPPEGEMHRRVEAQREPLNWRSACQLGIGGSVLTKVTHWHVGGSVFSGINPCFLDTLWMTVTRRESVNEPFCERGPEWTETFNKEVSSICWQHQRLCELLDLLDGSLFLFIFTNSKEAESGWSFKKPTFNTGAYDGEDKVGKQEWIQVHDGDERSTRDTNSNTPKTKRLHCSSYAPWAICAKCKNTWWKCKILCFTCRSISKSHTDTHEHTQSKHPDNWCCLQRIIWDESLAALLLSSCPLAG